LAEKAGVGGSTPSLATTFQSSYRRAEHSVHVGVNLLIPLACEIAHRHVQRSVSRLLLNRDRVYVVPRRPRAERVAELVKVEMFTLVFLNTRPTLPAVESGPVRDVLAVTQEVTFDLAVVICEDVG
jgi:hypothetical protein